MWEELIKAILNQEQAKANELINNMSEYELGRVSSDGWTALHWATWQGENKIAEFLLNHMHPRNINVTTHDGHTALHFAVFANRKEIVGLLTEYMDTIGVNTKDFLGRTALHLAAHKEEIAQILLANVKVNYNITPINILSKIQAFDLTYAMPIKMSETTEPQLQPSVSITENSQISLSESYSIYYDTLF